MASYTTFTGHIQELKILYGQVRSERRSNPSTYLSHPAHSHNTIVCTSLPSRLGDESSDAGPRALADERKKDVAKCCWISLKALVRCSILHFRQLQMASLQHPRWFKISSFHKRNFQGAQILQVSRPSHRGKGQ
jgi:hypothetical protein